MKIWRKKIVQVKYYCIFLLEIFTCIFLNFFLIYFNWRLITYNIVWFLPYIHMNQPWVYMCSPSWPSLPSPSPSHPSGSSQCTSPEHPVSCMEPGSISHMIMYMFQCYSLKSSHLRLLPQNPKVCSLHLCLFCCHAYRVIIAAAESLQSCPTLCDPIEGSPPGSPIPGILQARTPEWVAISLANAWTWKVKSEVTQSYLTLSDPMDCSPPGSPVPGILQARTLEWVAISLSNAWKWKVKSLSHIWLLVTPWTAAHQAPLSMGFSGQEYWSGVPLPSPRSSLPSF